MRAAAATRVDTLPMKATFPIVWTDEASYNPSATTPYIRATWVPNQTSRRFVGSADPHQRTAILQLDVMAKKTWSGLQASEIAGQVAAHFPADHAMYSGDVKCRVTAAPNVTGPIAGTVFMQVPVTIQIEAFA